VIYIYWNNIGETVASRFAAALAVFAGTLLIIANVVGSSGIVGIALGFLIDQFTSPASDALTVIQKVLDYIASLGGISVIGGGILIYAGLKWPGKLLIRVGAGMGAIGFLVLIISILIQGPEKLVAFAILASQSLGWIGIILALASTIVAR
jgi:hypothetical protein